MKLFYCILALGLTVNISAQHNPKDTSEWFDFWVGNWDITWKQANGTEGSGVNIIERVMSDRVIQENFEAKNGQLKGYIGKSWSVYNPRTRTWKQTWVDNQGGYLDFTGSRDGDRYMFSRSNTTPAGKVVQQRMVFHHITEDAFTWDWESSADGGETWKLQWRIVYKRQQP